MRHPWTESDRCVAWAIAFIVQVVLAARLGAHGASVLALGFAVDAVRRVPVMQACG